jgi:DNA-binding Lrp family transcriptional regulator
MKKLLKLLEEDCTLSTEQLAALSKMTPEEVEAAIAAAEEDKTIIGYQALVDWDKAGGSEVTAMIEVNVTPQRGAGFDAVAERIYQYEEVESCYLMSGGYDMCVTITGRTLKEVALFVSEKLAVIDEVTGTATHFILKKYKEKNRVFKIPEEQERGYFI